MHGHALETEWFSAYNQRTRAHNHAVFQDFGLLMAASVFPVDAVAKRWEARGRERLRWQFENLVTNEGVSIENTFGYHIGTLRLCDEAAQVAQVASIEKRCSAMRRLVQMFSYPDGRISSFGDMFRYSAKSPQNWRTQFEAAIGDYPTSGYFVARGGKEQRWQVNQLAPSLSATHKHADSLTLSYWANGIEWVIDPGFYSHEYDAPMNRYARGPRAHNALFVDGRSYSREPGKAGLEPVEMKDGRFVQRGWSEALEGFRVEREIEASLHEDSLTIADRIEGELRNGERPEFILHFGEQVVPTLKDTTVTLDHPQSKSSVRIALEGVQSCRLIHGDKVPERPAFSFKGFQKKTPV